MKVRILLGAVAACAVAGVLARPGQTAPALAERPPRWEYAELQFAPPFGAGFPAGGNGAAGRAATVWWVTAEGETEAAGWEDLATKLKAPPAKAEGRGPSTGCGCCAGSGRTDGSWSSGAPRAGP
jgi:hypothetical protein